MQGKKIVLTGEFNFISRDEATAQLEALGAGLLTKADMQIVCCRNRDTAAMRYHAR